jgi:hypothetical protein
MLKIHAVFIAFFLAGCQDAVKLDVVERGVPAQDNAQTVAYKPGSRVVVDKKNSESQEDSVPLIMLDPSKVCKDIAYYNKDGVLTQGERECDPSNEEANLQPQNIRAGIKIGSVVGTLVAADAVCSQDGETSCVTTEAWPAVSTQNLAAKIIMGETVAGVSGTANASSFSNCAADGGTACIATAAFPAAMASGLAGKVAAGQSVAGVAGTATVESHALCNADGGTACVVSLPYRAALTTGLSDKILQGQSVAGVSGTVTLPAASLVLSGTSFGVSGTSVTGNLTLPLAANVRASNGAFGVSGNGSTPTLGNCAADGDVGCVVVGPGLAAAVTGGLAAKVLAGQNVAGIAGTAAGEAHSDCAADGATACVATASYKAVEISTLAPKVISGQTVAGVAGSAAGEAHSDCAADGATACVATASFKAVEISTLAPKVITGQTVAGVAGSAAGESHINCSTDGAIGCVSTNSYKAVEISTLAPKVITGQTVAGVAGSAAGEAHIDCAADGATSCVATVSFKAVEISTLAPKVITGQTVAGVVGSAAGEAHINCTADGATDCVATNSYKAVEISTLAPKVITGQTVAGVAGSAAGEAHSDCTADGTTGCVATASYTAAATLALAPKILSGYRVAGVNGTATAESHTDCAADGSTGCVATSSYTAAATSALAPKIVAGFKVAGVDGTATAEYHNDCSADGTVGCVTTALYKSADTTGLASKVLSGQSVAGTSGNITLPTAGHVLSGISFGVSGNSVLGTLTLPTVANVRVSNGTYGVAGTGSTPTLADCSTNYALGCVTTGSYRSADFTNITAGNIKNGITLAGVAGSYPSASYPLAGNTATSDLTLATFNAKVKSSAAFEWFDATGTLHTGAGDTDIAAANINGSVDIFGTTGSIANCTGDGQTGCLTTNTYKSVDTSTLSAWDLRYGKSAGGLTGQIRTTCQNKINAALFNHDGTVTNSAVTTGTSNDPWDTVDNWNDNADVLPSTSIAGTGAESTCNTSTNVWMDVTADGVCDAGTDDCIFYDRMTQLYWSESYPAPATAPTMTSSNWAFAVNRCDTLTFGGFTDWRMPTQNDMMTAILHSIRDLGYKGGTAGTTSNNSNFINAVDDHYFWTSTSGSANTAYAWQYFMADGTAKVAQKTGSFSGAYNFTSICVRP